MPSKEEYFISTGNYDAPKPTIFKVEPVPYEEMEGHENSKGVLADMGQFVKSSIDKGVQAIKDLVTPESPAEFYATPEPYAYGIFFTQHSFSLKKKSPLCNFQNPNDVLLTLLWGKPAVLVPSWERSFRHQRINWFQIHPNGKGEKR